MLGMYFLHCDLCDSKAIHTTHSAQTFTCSSNTATKTHGKNKTLKSEKLSFNSTFIRSSWLIFAFTMQTHRFWLFVHCAWQLVRLDETHPSLALVCFFFRSFPFFCSKFYCSSNVCSCHHRLDDEKWVSITAHTYKTHIPTAHELESIRTFILFRILCSKFMWLSFEIRKERGSVVFGVWKSTRIWVSQWQKWREKTNERKRERKSNRE